MRNLKGILINVYKQSAIDGGAEAHELDDIVDFGLPFIEAQLELVKKLNLQKTKYQKQNYATTKLFIH